MPSPLVCTRCSQPLPPGAVGLCARCELDFSYSTRGVHTLDVNSDDQKATPNQIAPESTIQSKSRQAPHAETLSRHGSSEAGTESFDSERIPTDRLPNVPKGYEIRRLLGDGGMGEVYLAWDQTAERNVAMKFLRSSGRSAWQRFLVEVRALAAINHPNIVRVISTDFQRAEPFFTMEYASGGTLAEWVAQRGEVDCVKAAQIMSTVARAVEAAHQQGVLHRDLKPSNILLDADGSPKVSDFGLAKRMDRDDGVTIHAGAMGTPGYMPPEQIENHESIGAASDVYGLGATLFHVLTGRAPFTGETRSLILERVRTEPAPRLRSLRSSVPLALEGIVLKALAKDPAKRYRSAAEFADDLDRFIEGKPPRAPSLTLPHRIKLQAWRQRKRISVAAMMVCVAIGLVWLGRVMSGWGTGSDPAPAVPTAAEEIQQELAEGRTVSLLKADGLPRHYQSWLVQSIPEGDAEEASCTFQAREHGMLELTPNPKIDRYRVKLQIRHIDSRVVRGVDPFDRDIIAFYFGHSQAQAPDGATVHLFVAPSYSDCDPQAIPEKRAVRTQLAYIRELFLSQGEGHEVFSSRVRSVKPIQFLPPNPLPPGRWRPLVVDVTPDAVRVQWQADNGKMVDLVRWTGDKMRERYNGLRKNAEEKHPGVAAKLPEWTPQMPLGLYCFKTVAAVKDLTIEPLPVPKE